MVREKQVGHKVIYQGKVVDLFVDEIQVPDGSRHIREVVGHRPAVGIVPILADGQVILVRQFRYAVGKALWEIPAGLMDGEETPGQAARRELREETGRRAGSWKPLARLFSSPGFCREKVYLFLAQDLLPAGLPSLDPDEFITTKTFALEQALAMIRQGKIQDAKSAAGLVLASRELSSRG
jgi:ADP-ribose pyrophosphatase